MLAADRVLLLTMGLGRASSSLALLLLLTSTCSEASFIYRVPKDGDSCSTYRFTSSNVWFAAFLRRVFGDLPCGPGQVINSAGQCVDRDDDVADRCRDPGECVDGVCLKKRFHGFVSLRFILSISLCLSVSLCVSLSLCLCLSVSPPLSFFGYFPVSVCLFLSFSSV